MSGGRQSTICHPPETSSRPAAAPTFGGSSSCTASERHTRRKAGSQSHGTQAQGQPSCLSRRPARGVAWRASTTARLAVISPKGTVMIARIRKAMEEKDEGFTLIELLVVIIIIGILAAIAIPVFLNQRKKAVDSSMKSDVRTIANELETFATDAQAYPGTVTPVVGQITIGT